MFENAQIGDNVFSCIHGMGKIFRINQQRNYPVIVTFEFHQETYTFDGKMNDDDKYPELFWYSFAVPIKAKTPPARELYQWLYKDSAGTYHLTCGCFGSKQEARDAIETAAMVICPVIETARNSK